MSFEDKVKALKASIYSEKHADTKVRVEKVLKRIEKALENIPLTKANTNQLFAIVNDAFNEGDLPLLQKLNLDPGDKGENLMGHCVIGEYPQNAFNIYICIEGEGLIAYLWKVPERGNLRD